jgi:DNA-binding protein HU-beta
MTKAEIVNEIALKANLEKTLVGDIIEHFMKSVRNNLNKGEYVYLRGFGTFSVKERKRKIGRNVKKNIEIVIPAHNLPVFRPSKSFSDKIKKTLPVKTEDVQA